MQYVIGNTSYKVELRKDKYASDKSLALQMIHIDPEGFKEPFMTITSWAEVAPSEGCVWVKDYSENEGVADWLEANDIAVRTGRTLPAGFVELTEMKLNPNKEI